jgi:hypothetical protein
MIARPSHSQRAVAATCGGVLGLALLVTACADKGLTRPKTAFNPKIALQVTIIANQQVGFGPKFLIAAAGFNSEKELTGKGDDNGGGFLGFVAIPYAPGSQTLTVPVDLSSCLAYWADKGRDACPLLIGAAIVTDTNFVHDTTGNGDPFRHAFDLYEAGPFDIGPGGVLPKVPPINLSASRFAVVQWEGDDALRLGGNDTPNNISGPITGVAGVGTASATLFATGFGSVNTTSSNGNNNSQGPYPTLSIFQNGLWKRFVATVIPVNTGNGQSFSDVAAVSPSEVYMAHRSGLFKFDGSTISKVTAVTDSVFSMASGATPAAAKLVIAGGWNGVTWIYNGTSWTRFIIPGAPFLNGGVCITGANEAFAASTNNGALFRFDGTTWNTVSIAGNTASKVNLQCPAPGQAFVVAQNGQRFSWNGSGWTQLTNTGLASSGRSFTWAVVSPTEIYAAGDSAGVDRAFYKYNGSSWQEVGRLRFTQPLAEGWADPRGGAYFPSIGQGGTNPSSGLGRVDKVVGGSISVVSYAPSLRDVIMTSLSSAFVVGNQSFLARWNGSKWTVDAPPPGVTTNRNLRGVWSDGPNNAWAVGNLSTIFRYDGVGWSTVSGGAGDNYEAVWGVGSDVWVVGDASIVHCKAPSACLNEASGGSGSLYSVWGTSTTNVFAVGAGGRIARYNGTSWSAMSSPTSRTLYHVAGSGPSDAWAVGDSVILHFDGAQWTAIADPRNDVLGNLSRGQFNGQPGAPDNMGLWVRAANEVYVSGGNVTRFDGAHWDGMGFEGFRHMIQGLSGLSTGCALGVTETWTDSPAQTLWRGIGPSGCFLSPMAGPTSWP